ncbi:DNA alkylation repair protein [Weissella muntiaci]|uniref:DNA alkylation repair protein n=1 Tax=Weissella muntiaci TaxID=2508881 RepID=A0A6C2C4G8_9LACO|nr:DNA alkylation repair protein [Weissella muntiaci]TYC48483.1 DNA alkylation repair protein [Weissella muntiaci]
MEQIFELFRKQSDQAKATQMAHYLRDQFQFIGIKTPERRALSREFLKAKKAQPQIDWDFVMQAWEADEREFQYLASDYLRAMRKSLTSADLTKIKMLITTKSWWDSVDSLDELVGTITQLEPTSKSIILDWAEDENFWVRRVAIDHQLTFKAATDTELLAKVIQKNFDSTEFFINKAIGWALRDYSKSNPTWVREFLKEQQNSLHALSYREASKYL